MNTEQRPPAPPLPPPSKPDIEYPEGKYKWWVPGVVLLILIGAVISIMLLLIV